MRRLVLAAVLGLLASTGAAQRAAPGEVETVSEIARCLVEGLPADWVRAHMVVTLEAPGERSGGVRYEVARGDAADRLENFEPCDPRTPPTLLLELRGRQAPERRGWTEARLTLERDGSFRLHYDFPK